MISGSPVPDPKYGPRDDAGTVDRVADRGSSVNRPIDNSFRYLLSFSSVSLPGSDCGRRSGPRSTGEVRVRHGGGWWDPLRREYRPVPPPHPVSGWTSRPYACVKWSMPNNQRSSLCFDSSTTNDE